MNTIKRLDENVKIKKGNYYLSRDFSADLLDTPIYDDEKMDQVLEGIIQNIYIEMDKQGITLRGLGEMSCVNYSHLSRMFNGQASIGIKAMIKIAYALHISPSQLFPYDLNQRKTNGQRFDELTKEMDVTGCNFLLELCTSYVREWRRIKSGR